jgi:hypothetical protein
MTAADAAQLAALAVAGLLAGFAVGMVYFCLLRINARLYAEGGLRRGAIALHAARLAAAALFFWSAATFGSVPLVAALAGFVAARTVLLRRMVARP